MRGEKRPTGRRADDGGVTKKTRRSREEEEDVFFETEPNAAAASQGESDVEETAEEKKLQIAKQYLAKLKAEEEAGSDEDVDDRIRKRLNQEQEEPVEMREIAARIEASETGMQQEHAFFPATKWAPTSLSVTSDGTCTYMVDKNGSIHLYDTETGTRTKIPFERDFQSLSEGERTRAPWVSRTGSYGVSKRALIASAVTDDHKFLAVAGGDKHIHVFDPISHKHIQSFSGHLEAVSGLAFQSGTHNLFSCSYDRTVKNWSLDDLGFVDTLHGHESEIFDIDAMHFHKIVTSGNDRTCRIWKTLSDSQLVFRAPSLSMDCCRLINGTSFVSGSADGLQLWHLSKKKPIAVVHDAHRHSPSAQEQSWIQSLAVTSGADLIASGAADGCVRLWQAWRNPESERLQELRPVGDVLAARGNVTSVALSPDGRLVIAAVARRPRLGTWFSSPSTPNGVAVHRLAFH